MTFFTIPFEAGAADGTADGTTAGWDTGAAVCDVDTDGTVHPQMIAAQTMRTSRRTEHFRMKDRVGARVVILFLSCRGCRLVRGNRS